MKHINIKTIGILIVVAYILISVPLLVHLKIRSDVQQLNYKHLDINFDVLLNTMGVVLTRVNRLTRREALK